MTIRKYHSAVAGSLVGLALLLTGPAQARDASCTATSGCVTDVPVNPSKLTEFDGALHGQARGLALLLAGAAALVFVGIRRGSKSY